MRTLGCARDVIRRSRAVLLVLAIQAGCMRWQPVRLVPTRGDSASATLDSVRVVRTDGRRDVVSSAQVRNDTLFGLRPSAPGLPPEPFAVPLEEITQVSQHRLDRRRTAEVMIVLGGAVGMYVLLVRVVKTALDEAVESDPPKEECFLCL